MEIYGSMRIILIRNFCLLFISIMIVDCTASSDMIAFLSNQRRSSCIHSQPSTVSDGSLYKFQINQGEAFILKSYNEYEAVGPPSEPNSKPLMQWSSDPKDNNIPQANSNSYSSANVASPGVTHNPSSYSNQINSNDPTIYSVPKTDVGIFRNTKASENVDGGRMVYSRDVSEGLGSGTTTSNGISGYNQNGYFDTVQGGGYDVSQSVLSNGSPNTADTYTSYPQRDDVMDRMRERIKTEEATKGVQTHHYYENFNISEENIGLDEIKRVMEAKEIEASFQHQRNLEQERIEKLMMQEALQAKEAEAMEKYKKLEEEKIEMQRMKQAVEAKVAETWTRQKELERERAELEKMKLSISAKVQDTMNEQSKLMSGMNKMKDAPSNVHHLPSAPLTPQAGMNNVRLPLPAAPRAPGQAHPSIGHTGIVPGARTSLPQTYQPRDNAGIIPPAASNIRDRFEKVPPMGSGPGLGLGSVSIRNKDAERAELTAMEKDLRYEVKMFETKLKMKDMNRGVFLADNLEMQAEQKVNEAKMRREYEQKKEMLQEVVALIEGLDRKPVKPKTLEEQLKEQEEVLRRRVRMMETKLTVKKMNRGSSLADNIEKQQEQQAKEAAMREELENDKKQLAEVIARRNGNQKPTAPPKSAREKLREEEVELRRSIKLVETKLRIKNMSQGAFLANNVEQQKEERMSQASLRDRLMKDKERLAEVMSLLGGF